MQEYFKRQIQLWGEATQTQLQTKKIVIIGAGGLGSSLAYALGATGIGEIHLVDFDEVSLHNIHRQIAFSLEDEGKNKAQVNAQKIQNRCPYTQVFAHNCDFKTWSSQEICVDVILDATDNLPTRVEIDKYAQRVTTPWIYGSVEAFHGQVCFFESSSFEDAFKINNQTPAGIAAPIVMHIASLQANLALRYLADLPLKKDLLYYLFFNHEGEFITQKFTLPKK
jgi:molybdopterin/thiamine biosynthesis adenylyltransferase